MDIRQTPPPSLSPTPTHPPMSACLTSLCAVATGHNLTSQCKVGVCLILSLHNLKRRRLSFMPEVTRASVPCVCVCV